jgi:uncharacterized protein involved in exopolysaccharide biosynthesis
LLQEVDFMQQYPEKTEQAPLLPPFNADGRFLNLLLILARRKFRMLAIVLVAGVASAIVAFLLPNIYEANTKILLPQQMPSIASAFAGSSLAGIAGGAKDITSALKNPADVYVSMLQSRTLADAIIDRFNLMGVYHSRRRMDCRQTLSGNVIITSDKGGVISITVDDKDPKRAADIANGFVAELSQISQRLAVTEASQRRMFFEDQLRDEREVLVVAEAAMEHTQETSKLIAPESQTNAVMQGIAKLQEAISADEVQLSTIQTYSTERNANVERLKAGISSLRDQLAQYERKDVGDNGVIPTGNLPQAGLDYLRKAREVKYHESVMQILLLQYEAAKLDESREGTVMQVLDIAVPPEFKVRPLRKLIVAVTCFIALILSILWTLLEEVIEMVKANPVLSRQLDSLFVSCLGKHSFRLNKQNT